MLSRFPRGPVAPRAAGSSPCVLLACKEAGGGSGEAFPSLSPVGGVLTGFGVPFGPGLLGCVFP